MAEVVTLYPLSDTHRFNGDELTAAVHYTDTLVTRERIGRPVSIAGAQIASACRFHVAVCPHAEQRGLR